MYTVKSSSTKKSIGHSIGIILNGYSISRYTHGMVGSKSQITKLSSLTYRRNSDELTVETKNKPNKRKLTHSTPLYRGMSHFQKCHGKEIFSFIWSNYT